MSHVLRLAIVDPKDSSREELKSLLLGMDLVWLEAECSRYEFFSDVVVQAEPDVAIVHLDGDRDNAIALIQRVSTAFPTLSIVDISSSNDGDVILKAMRSGVKEFVTSPVQAEELVSSFERISQSRSGAGGSKSRGCRMIAIAGSSGGVGSTSLAVNLGCALARTSGRGAAVHAVLPSLAESPSWTSVRNVLSMLKG